MRFWKLILLAGLLLMPKPTWAGGAGECTNLSLVRLKTVDGVSLAGLWRQPQKAGHDAGAVMVHGYSGNFYSSTMEFLPEGLLEHGVCTLAVNMRDHDRVPKKNLFEENRYDIAAAVDEMAARGIHRIFLYGHSMGTNRVLDYWVSSKDPRIAGIVLTGPPGNLFEWNVRMFGKEGAMKVLEQAQGLKARGRGGEWMLVDLGPLGKTLYTADHLVSIRGAETFSDPFKNIARVSVPVLIVHGLADRLAEPAVSDRLASSARSGTEVKVVKVPGAGHQFRCCREALVSTVGRWIEDHLPR